GADSLYLTFLLKQWAQKHKCSLYAVTIDHKLRPESSVEAKKVHQLLTRHKIDHTILSWRGEKPKTRVEEVARDKRYELLLNFCKKHKAKALFLAHHQGDQAETFLSRLARGSGLDGLTAMHPVCMREGMLLVRPLLNMPKADIIQALKSQKIKWIEDPMNHDLIYERVRWRHLLPDLEKNGLNMSAICVATHRLQRCQRALEFYTDEFLKRGCALYDWGYVSLEKGIFEAQPLEIRVRSLMRLLKWMSPMDRSISLDSVEKIANTLPQHATLSGCQWVCTKNTIFLAQELKYMPGRQKVPACSWFNWGKMRLWTNQSFVVSAGAPKPRITGIPYLIQRTFPLIPADYRIISSAEMPKMAQKRLEKLLKEGYKNKEKVVMIELNLEKG
ncbi:MAG: tRNA lysidine(34) synthetase TilS, partial [Alphaproteobacteria bacterium]|nr:tRNA lysidine(34) synthetase TilS [Alphaproteobacteria bacterium]